MGSDVSELNEELRYAGTRIAEMVGKLMVLKKDYVNYGKIYVLRTQG
jgi:hypothetical protein